MRFCVVELDGQPNDHGFVVNAIAIDDINKSTWPVPQGCVLVDGSEGGRIGDEYDSVSGFVAVPQPEPEPAPLTREQAAVEALVKKGLLTTKEIEDAAIGVVDA